MIFCLAIRYGRRALCLQTAKPFVGREPIRDGFDAYGIHTAAIRKPKSGGILREPVFK